MSFQFTDCQCDCNSFAKERNLITIAISFEILIDYCCCFTMLMYEELYITLEAYFPI